MYNELIKRLREDKSWVEQGLSETEHEISEHIQQAANVIEELSKSRWIPVTERLPEAYQSVIVAVYCTDIVYLRDGETLEQAAERCQSYAAKNPYVELGFVDKDGLWNEYDGFAMVCSPSCWMPLPEPPKEVNNG